jgi:short-subunit dehydrogenase
VRIGDGRVCVVTGASSGIGRAVAVVFAGSGARVWAIGRSRERLEGLVEGAEGDIVSVPADLEREEDLERVASEVRAGGDRVDVLVHGAGAIELGTFSAATAVAFDRQYRVNLRAPLLLTQLLLPALRSARGQVVFVNSSAALKASAENVLYAATKHGLKALADGLREEVSPQGVRVTSIYVGRTDTPMQVGVHEFEGRPYRPELLLRPEDVAGAVLAAVSGSATADLTDISIRSMAKLPASERA